jgi:acetyl-CoA carboxylase biotin carboxylase subunit
MRRVASEQELPGALQDTRAEARAAFGDDAIYVEKLLDRPRHIEIQILADRFGHAIHLGERECTIQRRHQKVIEECPSPVVDDDLRRRMAQAALRVVKAVDYHNAGTVEFLVDQNLDFYFLEMNTRIQVEHSVTEAVTGIDLVQEQIRIAAGEPLNIRQDQVEMRGAAIECRVYAEDPANNFLPSPGRIESLQLPSGPGIRNDSGVYAGWTVPLEYDPLLSKLIVWAPSREAAIDRMRRALGEYRITGIRDNLGFLKEIFEHPDIFAGKFDTGFIERWLAQHEAGGSTPVGLEDRDLAIIFAALSSARSGPAPPPPATERPRSQWKRAGRDYQLKRTRNR